MAESIDHTDPDARLREVLKGFRDDPDALIEIIVRQVEQIDQLRSERPMEQIERLQSRVQEMEEEIGRLRGRVRELNEETERLREERDEAERAGKRQAASFRVDEEKRAEDPDPPGREEGHKVSSRREPEQIDRRVEVPIEGCPECGEEVTDVRRWS